MMTVDTSANVYVQKFAHASRSTTVSRKLNSVRQKRAKYLPHCDNCRNVELLSRRQS